MVVNNEGEMMANPEILKTKLNEFVSGETDNQILAALNANTIPDLKPIDSIEIEAYLILAGKWMPIYDGISFAAREAVQVLRRFPYLRTSNPVYKAKLVATMDNLIAESLIDTTDKDSILSLGNGSWAYQNNDGRDLNHTDLANARAWL